MHIIFGSELADELRQKYIVLELDRIRLEENGPVLDSYCVLETNQVSLDEIGKIDSLTRLHSKLMENYRKKDWNFCEQALEHLHGSWKGTVNSFYDVISQRIAKYKEQDPGPEWNGIYEKFNSGR